MRRVLVIVLLLVSAFCFLKAARTCQHFYAVGCSCGDYGYLTTSLKDAEDEYQIHLQNPSHNHHTLFIVRGCVYKAVTICSGDCLIVKDKLKLQAETQDIPSIGADSALESEDE